MSKGIRLYFDSVSIKKIEECKLKHEKSFECHLFHPNLALAYFKIFSGDAANFNRARYIPHNYWDSPLETDHESCPASLYDFLFSFNKMLGEDLRLLKNVYDPESFTGTGEDVFYCFLDFLCGYYRINEKLNKDLKIIRRISKQ